ncbi:CD276 antigen-like isoform X2 [Esox lucius]|uniref:CD276 antigen-like isoform X2 n=1 Tax=Esox lucius TaxID=8010 RepID=UPI0014769AEE|nr:CD276 antigen-like isoform X2 [Esox lucius]
MCRCRVNLFRRTARDNQDKDPGLQAPNCHRHLMSEPFKAAAFKVRTPQPVVLAIYGQPAILKCLFPASSDRVDPSLVVTWQRVEDSQVVHSFYYGTDQLDRQSVRYHNRTKLFHSQLADGNASLRLDRVGPEDQGRYLCSATNTNGSGKIVVQLKYAAFYTEPRLTVCGRTSNVTFLYETEGYPEPEVHWLDPQGFKLDYNLSVTQSARAPGLLLSLRAQLVVQAGLPINYTFSLKNQVLEQVIERPLSYVSTQHDHNDCPRYIPTLLSFLIPVGICIVVFLGYRCLQHKF